MAAEGLTTIKSHFGPKDTMNRLEAEVKARGMTVFAHIPHEKGAAAVGVPLRPNDLLIFGNAKVGTPLMQSAPTIGIDLPLKVWFGRTLMAVPGSPTTIRLGSRSGTGWALMSKRRSKP